MMEDMLFKACRKLRFGSTVIENAKRIEKTDTISFLLELFRLELANRELKRKNTYIKAAKSDVFKTFEDYTFNDIKIPRSITPDDIIATNFISKTENLILYGNVGRSEERRVGKECR